MKKVVSYPDGGKIEGNTHNQGGVKVNGAGQPEVEIEGGERLFSVEDTETIEGWVAKMNATEEIEEKNELALRLGHKVSKMVAAQDQRQEIPTDDEFLADGGDEPFDEPTEFID
jgi:hypothetical protein